MPPNGVPRAGGLAAAPPAPVLAHLLLAGPFEESAARGPRLLPAPLQGAAPGIGAAARRAVGVEGPFSPGAEPAPVVTRIVGCVGAVGRTPGAPRLRRVVAHVRAGAAWPRSHPGAPLPCVVIGAWSQAPLPPLVVASAGSLSPLPIQWRPMLVVSASAIVLPARGPLPQPRAVRLLPLPLLLLLLGLALALAPQLLLLPLLLQLLRAGVLLLLLQLPLVTQLGHFVADLVVDCDQPLLELGLELLERIPPPLRPEVQALGCQVRLVRGCALHRQVGPLDGNLPHTASFAQSADVLAPLAQEGRHDALRVGADDRAPERQLRGERPLGLGPDPRHGRHAGLGRRVLPEEDVALLPGRPRLRVGQPADLLGRPEGSEPLGELPLVRQGVDPHLPVSGRWADLGPRGHLQLINVDRD
mmetsp:Transcript_14328/g.44259  ORF Transcript_14328/g.44259 Transcript_14328/m.44259 type:complete len:415 (-) Transcript_14328:388-1632(-)